MHDMLVKLYDLNYDNYSDHQNGILVRKPIGPERCLVIDWVRKKFNSAWASETSVALSNRPSTCFIALQNKKIVGFACYDATALGYFGPMGVSLMSRKKGIGELLLKISLLDMKNRGYGYAIIGGVGPAKFYEKTVGAVDIEGSDPGIWKTWVRDGLF